MFLNRIHYRLIVFFTGLMIVLMTITGLTLRWNIRSSLEQELGARLEAVAAAVSVQFDTERFIILQNAGSRTHASLRTLLQRIQRRSGLLRITLFDDQFRSLLDTDTIEVQNREYFRLRFYPQEMERIQTGQTAHSVLFTGINGDPVMTGFAPVMINGKMLGGIAVDGSAQSLDAVDRLNQRLILIGFIGVIATIILAALLARTITQPVSRLVRASRRIGAGDYAHAIPEIGTSEIGTLSHTMEEMRQNVVQREQNLKAMVAGIAHEIRNPLGGIELFLGLLRDEIEENEQAQTHLNKITGEVRSLNGIVQHFLEYARPKDPHIESCDLQDLISEIQMLTAGESERTQIIWQINLDEKAEVCADRQQLKRILLNLIQNSIHAMPEGGTLTIQSDRTDKHIHLRISDTGNGIPENIREQIFTPFFTTREKGTGLGLSIVKNLIEANGGSIRLKKSDVNGTVFELKLKCGDRKADTGNRKK